MNRICRRVCALIAPALLLAGCATPPPLPDTEDQLRTASGMNVQIVRQDDALPLDAPGDEPQQLALVQAMHDAVTNDPALQAALAQVQVVWAEAHQARLLPNPVLSVVLRIPESGAGPIVEAGLAAELLSLLRKPGEIEVADHRLRAASAQTLVTLLDTIAQVQEQYAQVQTHVAQQHVLEEQRQTLSVLEEKAAARLRAGEGTRLDVTTLQAQVVDADLQIADLEQEARAAQLELTERLGRPSGPANWVLDSRTTPPIPADDDAAWVRLALQHRPELQAARWELAALGAEQKNAGWLLTEAEVGVDSEYDDRVWSVGPSLSIPLPIFDWGQARQNVARARRQQALHELTAAQRRIVGEVRRALAALHAARAALERLQTRWTPLLEKRGEEAQTAYRAGEAELVNLILAEQDLQAARTRRIELEHKLTLAWIRFQRAIGGPAALAAAFPVQPVTTPIHQEGDAQ